VILIKSAGELLEHWSGMRGIFFSARVKSITAEATHFLARVSGREARTTLQNGNWR
jgi:hypothetical protein